MAQVGGKGEEERGGGLFQLHSTLERRGARRKVSSALLTLDCKKNGEANSNKHKFELVTISGSVWP